MKVVLSKILPIVIRWLKWEDRFKLFVGKLIINANSQSDEIGIIIIAHQIG